jgi:hypothetical protein
VLRAPRPISDVLPSETRFALAEHWLCLDGGGKWRQQQYVAFCGFMDTVEHFEMFTNHWKHLLNQHHLPHGLHCTDAMRWDGPWRQFKLNWGADCDERRSAVIGEFISLIKQNPTMQPIGVAADSRHISRKAQEAKRPDLMLFEHAIRIATERATDHRLSILCDWEDGFDELCCKLLRKLRVKNVANARAVDLIGFGDDRTYSELQAADLFAYLACKELQRAAERPEEDPDPLYTQLMSGVPVPSPSTAPLGEMFDAETFLRMIETQSA